MAETENIARQLLSDLKRDFGMTNEQAAGVVGNLMHESGGFSTLQEVNPTVPGSKGGYGFAQWTGDRRKAFDDYVEQTGADKTSYDANYGFLKHELSNNRYERNQFNKVKKAQTAEEAAKIVSENYLRPGIPHNSSRVRYANEALGYANSPVPPGEIPEVATALSTVPTPPATPMPPRPVGRDNLITQTMAQLRKPSPQNAGDSLALNPVQGGKTGGPMFDAAYDTTSQAMRTLHNPIQSGGMAWGDTAPTPASPHERVTARNTSLPPVRRLPDLPPSAPTAPTVTASDRARGNNAWQTIATVPTDGSIGQPPATRAVQSVPVPPTLQAAMTAPPRQIPGQSYAGQDRAPGLVGRSPYVAPTVPSFTPLPPLPKMDGFDVANKDQSRLVADLFPMAPGGEVPVPGMPGSIPAPGAMPPMPFARPQRTASAMPPMPMARPAFLGQQLPQQAVQRQPLRIQVNGGNVQRPAPQPVQRPTPKGYTDTGNGRLVSDQTGGIYYTRNLPGRG